VAYSIVVVTWNCAEHVRALIASMNRHLTGDQELVVVDNASDDDPASALEEWKGPRRFIALEENLGFGPATNRGVAEASGEVTVMLNPDTELVDAGLDRLVTVAAELAGLVGPRVCNPDGSIQASASGPEVGAWPWLRALVPGGLQPPGMVARTEPSRLERRTPVTWLTGACIAGPTRTLRGLGPFDPALHMFGEDVDLGLRATAAGVRSWFDPEACSIVHYGQGSSTLVYGSREGWRSPGTLNWRAAVRRAHGARREYLGWLALRVNLRLRLTAKTLLGRATDRDREAVRAASSAKPVPRLEPRDPAAILTGVTRESG
jgi:N-acetylglucosaminyl-diphospho-decaprenol L-rhamnosyltransferase